MATHMTKGVTWSYTYDANGLRTGRTNGSTTYQYIYAGDKLVRMIRSTASVTDVVDFGYAGGQLATMTYNGVTYYYVLNGQGDVIGLTDATGKMIIGYHYGAYGTAMAVAADATLAPVLAQANPLLYRGYVYDRETSLYYLQSRYYDPEMGRFINADVYASTGQGVLGNNMFAYCGNGPIIRKDSVGTAYVFLSEFTADVDLDGQFDEAGSGGGGGWGLGVKPSYYTAKSTQAYNWNWQNSSYNTNIFWSSGQTSQSAATVDAFGAYIKNPTSIVGKTASDMATELGDGWTQGTYGTEGNGWKFLSGDKMVAYHPGGGRHVGSYYKLSSAETGKIKIVGPDYVEIPGDRARIIRHS